MSFNINLENEKIELLNLLNSNLSIEIHNEIDSQLQELIKLRNPEKVLDKNELQKKIEFHLDGVSSYEYGNWVYYPWSKKLVHLLGEDEFIEVRTNRNQYKITPDEEIELSKKKIGCT